MAGHSCGSGNDGSRFSTAEAAIYSADGKLIASGRGTYYTAPPPPPKA